MDPRLSGLLEQLHEEGVEHDRGERDRLRRLRNLEPESASVLAVLVRAAGARRVLELGSSNGYSTLWLADAAAAVGGRLVSVEIDAARSELAAYNLDRGGLREVVELRCEDAARTLAASSEASWDLIFLDAERPAYVDYWPDLVRVLRPGGLLVLDNVLSHAEEVREFRALVADDARVSGEAVIPTGAGLLLLVVGSSRAEEAT